MAMSVEPSTGLAVPQSSNLHAKAACLMFDDLNAPKGWLCTCVMNSDYVAEDADTSSTLVDAEELTPPEKDPGYRMRASQHSASTLDMVRFVKLTASGIQQRLLHRDGGFTYISSPAVIYPHSAKADDLVPANGRTEVVMRYTKASQLEVVILVIGPAMRSYGSVRDTIVREGGTTASWCATICAKIVDDYDYAPGQDTVLVTP